MERNKEIATSANLADSLTEQQCDVLEWASDMRHEMHKNSEALYDVNAPKHKEIKAFISDTHYSQNPNNLNKRLKDVGLPLIKWSFDDTRIPTNELAMILDNRKLEKSRKRQCIRTLEKANADIENYRNLVRKLHPTTVGCEMNCTGWLFASLFVFSSFNVLTFVFVSSLAFNVFLEVFILVF